MTRNLRTQVVDLAEHALRSWFGDDISREDAARLLPGWRFVGGLDDELRAEVLGRFSPAEPPSVPGKDWLPSSPRDFEDAHGCTWRETSSGRLSLLDANGEDSGIWKDRVVVERLYGPLVGVQPDAEPAAFVSGSVITPDMQPIIDRARAARPGVVLTAAVLNEVRDEMAAEQVQP